MKNTTTIGFVLCLGLLSCSKESASGTGSSPLEGTKKFNLIPIGEHQLVFGPLSKPPTSLCILDWGEEDRPAIDLAAPIEHFELENDGHDLVLIGGGKAMVRFSVGNDS